MITVFEILLVISSLLMILLVLLHKGRGGGLSDMFGGGVSSGLGGSSVAERNLDSQRPRNAEPRGSTHWADLVSAGSGEVMAPSYGCGQSGAPPSHDRTSLT